LLVAGLGGILVFALNLITIIDVMNLPGDEREKRKQFFKRVYGKKNNCKPMKQVIIPQNQR
jgi:hypothetical protein